jgi:hypothetical protein
MIQVIEMKVEIPKKGTRDFDDYGRAQNMILLQVLINLGKLLNRVHCIKGYCIFSIANPRSLTNRMDTLDNPGHVVLLRLRAFLLPEVPIHGVNEFSPTPTYIQGVRLTVRPSIILDHCLL